MERQDTRLASIKSGLLRCGISTRQMSESGHKRRPSNVRVESALPSPKRKSEASCVISGMCQTGRAIAARLLVIRSLRPARAGTVVERADRRVTGFMEYRGVTQA